MTFAGQEKAVQIQEKVDYHDKYIVPSAVAAKENAKIVNLQFKLWKQLPAEPCAILPFGSPRQYFVVRTEQKGTLREVRASVSVHSQTSLHCMRFCVLVFSNVVVVVVVCLFLSVCCSGSNRAPLPPPALCRHVGERWLPRRRDACLLAGCK